MVRLFFVLLVLVIISCSSNYDPSGVPIIEENPTLLGKSKIESITNPKIYIDTNYIIDTIIETNNNKDTIFHTIIADRGRFTVTWSSDPQANKATISAVSHDSVFKFTKEGLNPARDTFEFVNLTPNRSYTVYVSSYYQIDSTITKSSGHDSASIELFQPRPPANIRIANTGQTLSLQWDKTTDPYITDYTIYLRDTAMTILDSIKATKNDTTAVFTNVSTYGRINILAFGTIGMGSLDQNRFVYDRDSLGALEASPYPYLLFSNETKRESYILDNSLEMSFAKGGPFIDSSIWEDSATVRKEVFVPSFFASKTEITNKHYLNFVNDLLQKEKLIVKDSLIITYDTNNVPLDTLDTLITITDSLNDSTKSLVLESNELNYNGTAVTMDSLKLNNPIVFVTDKGAIQYCQWLSEKHQKKYRLPTALEFEYLLSNGYLQNSTKSRYPWGFTYDTKRFSSTNISPVGSFPISSDSTDLRNSFQDLCGNVAEWVIADSTYYLMGGSADNATSSTILPWVWTEANLNPTRSIGFRIVEQIGE